MGEKRRDDHHLYAMSMLHGRVDGEASRTRGRCTGHGMARRWANKVHQQRPSRAVTSAGPTAGSGEWVGASPPVTASRVVTRAARACVPMGKAIGMLRSNALSPVCAWAWYPGDIGAHLVLRGCTMGGVVRGGLTAVHPLLLLSTGFALPSLRECGLSWPVTEGPLVRSGDEHVWTVCPVGDLGAEH